VQLLRPVVIVACLAGLAASDAQAKAPGMDPDRLAAFCASEPDGALCREVRRLCAAQTVRPAMVPACKTLGWYGDTTLRQVQHLCPTWPEHPRCAEIKAACTAGRAATLGPTGVDACRAAGWTDEVINVQEPPPISGQDDDAITPEQADLVVSFCQESPNDQRCLDLRGACKDLPVREGELITGVCKRLGFPMHGAPGVVEPVKPLAAFPRPVVEGEAIAATHIWMGYAAGKASDPVALGRSDWLGIVAVESTSIGLRGVPWAVAAHLHLGVTEEYDFYYRGDMQLGVGVVGSGLELSLTSGAGVSGVADGHVPMAVHVPARLEIMAHLSPRVAALAWMQTDWLFADDVRASGSRFLDFADSGHAGLMLFFGHRRPMGGRHDGLLLSIGGIWLEQNDEHILLGFLGMGMSIEPFPRGGSTP
jgi:hypothetical protein